MKRDPRIVREQDGSLPLVLLVAIIVGGTIAVLFSVVNSGVQSSGRDRDFASAIQVADAGLQEAYTVLGEALTEGSLQEFLDQGCDQPYWFTGNNTEEQGACAGSVAGDVEYDWSYTCDAGLANCEVLAVGRHRGSARAVQASVTTTAQLGSGITGYEDAEWVGGGSADGEGFWMGTFGCVTIPSSAVDLVLGINYYGNSLAEDQASGGCWQPNAIKDKPVNVAPDGVDFSVDPATAYCTGDDAPPILEDVPEEVAHGSQICVERAYFPMGFTLTGDPTDEPTRIYVYDATPGNADAVRIGGGGGPNALEPEINWGSPPDASALSLYVAANAGDVWLRTGAKAAMSIWAPGSTCDVHPTGEFVGTITCYDVKLRGTYSFQSTAVLEDEQAAVMEGFSEERVPASRRGLTANQ